MSKAIHLSGPSEIAIPNGERCKIGYPALAIEALSSGGKPNGFRRPFDERAGNRQVVCSLTGWQFHCPDLQEALFWGRYGYVRQTSWSVVLSF
jgi:hypothetical protein